jgi:methyl-accepting chemotaxis protein
MPEETFRWVITGGVAIAALCILIMAVAVVAMYKVISRVQTRVEDISGRVSPILDTARRVADENAPKISKIASSAVVIAANAEDISGVAKNQAHRFAEVGRDIADRTKAQVARMDAAVDETVENVHQAMENAQHAGEQVKAAVLKPVREAGAVAAGLKAAFSTFAQGKRPTVDHITQDEEMFI